jgi:hypothetical protein
VVEGTTEEREVLLEGATHIITTFLQAFIYDWK